MSPTKRHGFAPKAEEPPPVSQAEHHLPLMPRFGLEAELERLRHRETRGVRAAVPRLSFWLKHSPKPHWIEKLIQVTGPDSLAPDVAANCLSRARRPVLKGMFLTSRDRSSQMAMGQKPKSAVNIPNPTKIGSKMGGAHTPKWYHWF